MLNYHRIIFTIAETDACARIVLRPNLSNCGSTIHDAIGHFLKF